MISTTHLCKVLLHFRRYIRAVTKIIINVSDDVCFDVCELASSLLIRELDYFQNSYKV